MSQTIYGKSDPREVPAYSIYEAAGYLRIPIGTLRTWVRGRRYANQGMFNPLIELPKEGPGLLSFINLVEAHVLTAIRVKHNIAMPNVRKAIAYLNLQSPSKHPLADSLLQTDGVDLFIEEYGKLVNLSKGGQLAMKEILTFYLQRIDHDPHGVALRLYPMLRRDARDSPKTVVIDPFVSFGKPTIQGTGVRTSVVADRYFAGDSMDFLASDFSLTQMQIEEAIRYEAGKRAA